jgi:flagella basal body P-ring formation protein FlgA
MRRAIVLSVVLFGSGAAAGPVTVTPQEAIAAAVSQRLGASASVTVLAIDTRVTSEPGLTAQPDATARLRKPARFVMMVRGVRRGLAVATVTAKTTYPRAARIIARDEEIDRGAVDFIAGELPAMPIRPLLGEVDVVGLKARRAIAIGEPLTASVLRLPPVVRSGEEVNVTVRIGAVRVIGSGFASGSGQVGDVIRITQPHHSRLLKGRITGPGAVEILE